MSQDGKSKKRSPTTMKKKRSLEKSQSIVADGPKNTKNRVQTVQPIVIIGKAFYYSKHFHFSRIFSFFSNYVQEIREILKTAKFHNV